MSNKFPPKAGFAQFLTEISNTDGSKRVELEEPLLKQQQHEVVKVSDAERKVEAVVSSATTNSSSINTLSLVTGSIVALISQVVLSMTLWDDHVLQKPTMEVIKFSFAWSFWTCLIVFVSMSFFVATVRKCCPLSFDKKSGASDNEDDDEDDTLFQLEAHYVVGALVSISISWLMKDLFQSQTQNAERVIQIHPVLTVLLAASSYALFVRWILAKRNDYISLEQEMGGKTDESNRNQKLDKLSPTFEMVSATLGIIIGVCSQFILSMIFWKDNMTKPIVNSVVLFSFLWSIVTVAITFTVCMSLRFMVTSSAIVKELPTVTEKIQRKRVLLRMEAAYASSSLIGICIAWIIIDLLTGMTDQIVPSIVMLIASLFAFRAILHYFPEEKCLGVDDCKSIEVV